MEIGDRYAMRHELAVTLQRPVTISDLGQITLTLLRENGTSQRYTLDVHYAEGE